MAASEINDRLDYLFSYSSQMVLICSDKIPKPSQVIEEFLSNQSEQTDLALLTANELMPLVSYREKLSKQLLGKTQFNDFNRPLNQLLAELNQHQNPVVIAIFQADKLPNRLVKELWELVLQSRFAKNQLQINILLVGESHWAQQIKDALGSRSKEQPILLNTANIQPHFSDNNHSELDALLHDKRQKFAQRLQARQQTERKAFSPLKTWWVWVLLGLTFLVLFAGLISWQYPDKLKQLIQELNPAILSEASTEQTQPAIATQLAAPIVESNDLSATSAEAVMLPADLTINTLTTTNTEATQAHGLVTDWQSARDNLAKKAEAILQAKATNPQARVKVANHNPQAPASSISDAEMIPSNSEPLTNSQAQATNTTDYAVVDEYQPLPQVQAVTVTPDMAELPIEVPTELAPNPAARLQNPDNQIMLNLPETHYVIQIAAMSNEFIVREFLQNPEVNQQVWLYKTQRYGGDWFVLVAKPSFESNQQARLSMQTLNEELRRNTPFVKSVQQVKQEIRLTSS
ncbi:SPOR domain-containing protein [Paraglaciecola aestuariivivens]